jgi:hypothetical protein
MDMKRRHFLLALLALMVPANPVRSFADNDGGGGGGNSGPGGGGGNSGPGGGGGGDDDDGGDDGDDDKKDEKEGKDQERALEAVRRGKVTPLSELFKHLKDAHPGRVLKVNLVKSGGNYFYRVRILTSGNRVKTYVLNAKTLAEAVY